MHTCYVPTLTALSSATCAPLFSVAREIRGKSEVTFDFSTCRFLRPQAVAFLGGLIRLAQHHGGVVYILWDTMIPAIKANLAQNGFALAFGGAGKPWAGNSVPYLEHTALDPRAFADYIHNAWLGRGWVGVSELLANQITGNVSEAYINAFEHSASPTGVQCCGQYFPKMKRLSLTMVDFGVGVPFNVRQFKASEFGENLSAASCLEWAFQSGTSTRAGAIAGGLGLHNLCQFVSVNGGELDFYSHDALCVLRDGTISFTDRPDHFPGTMVTVELRCDNRYYLLGSELASHNPFQS